MTSKTSLAYINSTFEEVLDKQITAAPASVKARAAKESVRTIAGFAIADPAAESRVINKHLESMKAYALNRASLIAELSKKGIPVLATLPTDLWDKICTASDLIRFTPDAHGRVSIEELHGTTEELFRKSETTTLITVATTMALLFGAVAMYLFTPTRPLQWMAMSGIWVAASAMSTLLITAIFGTTLAKKMFRAKLTWTGEAGLSKLFKFTGANGYNNQIGISLPTPPADVAQTLLTASSAGYQLKVAAVREAVTYIPSLQDTMVNTNHRRLRELEEEARIRAIEEARRRDPIVYIESHGVIAVIAQFGDFPVEKALIDKLVAEEVTEVAY